MMELSSESGVTMIHLDDEDVRVGLNLEQRLLIDRLTKRR
ncbi:MAG: hypothetical protein ACI9K5_004192 [Gammaproteobacteria bacterium]|jgi:hypothetical protein